MLFNLIAGLLVVVAIIDFFASRQAIEALRTRLITYWIFVEELPLSQEVPAHLAAIRSILLRNVKFAIGLLGLILLGFSIWQAAFLAIEIKKDPSAYVKEFNKTGIITHLINMQYDIAKKTAALDLDGYPHRLYEYDSKSILKREENCKVINAEQGCKKFLSAVSDAEKKRSLSHEQYHHLETDQSTNFATKILLALTAVNLIYAAILFFSFVLSLFVTLKILQATEKYVSSNILYFFVDLFIAIVVPLSCLTTISFIAVFLGPLDISNYFQMPEPGEFFSVNLAKWLASSSFYADMGQLTSSKFYLNLMAHMENPSQFYFITLKGPFSWGYLQLRGFVSDLNTVLFGDWTKITLSASQRNWAIGFSLAFSLSYVFAILALLLTKRSRRIRYAVSRILQYLIEHPRSPVAGLSMFLAGLIFISKIYFVR